MNDFRTRKVFSARQESISGAESDGAETALSTSLVDDPTFAKPAPELCGSTTGGQPKHPKGIFSGLHSGEKWQEQCTHAVTVSATRLEVITEHIGSLVSSSRSIYF